MSAPSSSTRVPILGVYSSSGPCSVPTTSIATSPPLSSEPKSLPPSLLQRSSQSQGRIGGGGGGPFLGGPFLGGGGGVESKFFETRAALKDIKRKNREQARKARQLVTAVAAKIEEKDEEMERLRSVHNAELSAICQQLLSLQSSMAKEKARLKSILDEKDVCISSQKSELDRLNLLVSGGSSKKKKQRESSPKVEAPSKAAQGQGHQMPHTVGSHTLDRHRPPGSSSAASAGRGGGVRIHGSSFRQYKREQKVKSKVAVVSSPSQEAEDPCSPSPSSSSDLGSLGSTSLSSEENSSPNMTPKSTHRPALRLSVSAPGTTAPPPIPTPPPLPPSFKLTKNPPPSSSSSRRSHLSSSSSASTSSSQYNSLSFPKKGILKQSSSYGSLDSSAAASMLHNLHKLIETNKPPTKISGEENRSDSGRESDEVEDSSGSGRRRTRSLPPITVNKMKLPSPLPPPIPPKSFHHSRGGSCNSSFDDSGICLTSSTTRLSIRGGGGRREKPKPPPRSSTTRLTSSMRRPEPPPKLQSSGNKNATIVTISMDDSINNNEDEKKKAVVKKVKFNPEVSTSETAVKTEDDEEDNMEKNAIKLLEESILNFKGNKARRIREEGDETASRGRRIEDCVSYYEPYI